MDQPALITTLADEDALGTLAHALAAAWRRSCAQVPLSIGLRGELGAGKTAFVRALLRGLGYRGRVPSPTYTLTEIYEIDGINLIHIDFYRISDASELAPLGLRDWLGQPGCWLLCEWPQRVEGWQQRCDLLIDIAVVSASARQIGWTAGSETGLTCLADMPRSAG